MVELLADTGAEAEWTGPNEVRVHAAGPIKTELDEELCTRDPRLVPARRPAARARGPRHRAAARRRRDRPAPARHAHPRLPAARRRDRDHAPLRHAGGPARRAPALPRRGERDGHRERRDGGRARGRRDGDRERGLRAARAGSLPLPRLARRRDRRDRLERAPHQRRRAPPRRRAPDRARAHRGRELHRPRGRHRRRHDDRGRRARRPDLDPARVREARRRASRSTARACASRPARSS